jgi:hypothetical protein
MSLSLPEEIILLTLDDATGRPLGRQGLVASLAIAGAGLLPELPEPFHLDRNRERGFRQTPAV